MRGEGVTAVYFAHHKAERILAEWRGRLRGSSLAAQTQEPSRLRASGAPWARLLFSFPHPPGPNRRHCRDVGEGHFGFLLLVSRKIGQFRGEAEPEWVRPIVVARASGIDKTEGHGPPPGVTPHTREREQRERMRNGEEEKL